MFDDLDWNQEEVEMLEIQLLMNLNAEEAW